MAITSFWIYFGFFLVHFEHVIVAQLEEEVKLEEVEALFAPEVEIVV